jgi:hypothetical protein
VQRTLGILPLTAAVVAILGFALYVDYGVQSNSVRVGMDWEVIAYDAQRRVVAYQHIRDGVPLRLLLITDTGFDDLVRKAVGQSSGQPTGAQYVAIGTGSTCTAASTGLVGESARVLATYDEPATKQFRLTATFSSVSGIQSAGAFNAAVSGVLLSCQTFASITADTLEIRITYTLS